MQLHIDTHALIIDMDGVLWHGTQPLPGLKEFFHTLREKKLPFVLATNNASLTQEQYLAKLKKMDISVCKTEILTSSMVTALYLSQLTPPEFTRLFVIGEEGLRQPLIDQGFTLIDTYQSTEVPADFVVCGLDRQLTWNKLADASLHLNKGAKFIATNADTTLPTEQGPVTGNGAILAALQAATRITPTIIGKPEPIMYQQAINILGVAPENTVAIGDRLDTDILGAVNAEIKSIMVLTGISTREDLKQAGYQPTWVLPDLPAITKALLKIKT